MLVMGNKKLVMLYQGHMAGSGLCGVSGNSSILNDKWLEFCNK